MKNRTIEDGAAKQKALMKKLFNILFILFCSIATGVLFQLNHMLHHDFATDALFRWTFNSFFRMFWLGALWLILFLVLRFVLSLLIRRLKSAKKRKILFVDSLLHLIVPFGIVFLMFSELPNKIFYSNLIVFWIAGRLVVAGVFSRKELFSIKLPIVSINSLFFVFIGLFLVVVDVIAILNLPLDNWHKFFVFIESVLYVVFLLSSILALVSIVVSFLPMTKVLKNMFWSLSFLLIPLFIIDYWLVRYLGVSVFNGLVMMFSGNVEHFLAFVEAIGLRKYVWALFLLPIALSFIGFCLYILFGVIFPRFVSVVKLRRILCLALFSACFIIIISFFMHSSFDFKVASSVEKVMPIKYLLFKKSGLKVVLDGKLNVPKKESDFLRQLKKDSVVCQHTPDIFLFVIESLRDDFITKDIAPHLYQFKAENVSFDSMFANANMTHLSWMSIFHSMYPHYWASLKKTGNNVGSIPLYILKKLGYKINLFTTPHFGFYDMEKWCFGENRDLLDCYQSSKDYRGDSTNQHCVVAIQDQLIMKRMLNKLFSTSKGGNLFIVFLDATHFPYEYRDGFEKFVPVVTRAEMCKISSSSQFMTKVKNRYSNSVYHLDSLFGDFFAQLKKTNRFHDSIIVITGDHGEEFMENGKFTHGSNLTKEQIGVPIYYKFDKAIDNHKVSKITSHIDILPTILDYLGLSKAVINSFDGSSIFDCKKNYAFSVCQKGTHNPSKFSFCDGKRQIVASFNNSKNIFNSKKVNVESCKNYITNEDIEFNEDDLLMLKDGLKDLTTQ